MIYECRECLRPWTADESCHGQLTAGRAGSRIACSSSSRIASQRAEPACVRACAFVFVMAYPPTILFSTFIPWFKPCWYIPMILFVCTSLIVEANKHILAPWEIWALRKRDKKWSQRDLAEIRMVPVLVGLVLRGERSKLLISHRGVVSILFI